MSPSRDEEPRSSAPELVYRIDRDDRICHVNPVWANCALDNGHHHFMPEQVVGRPLWSFFEDQEVKGIYARVVERVRAGHRMQFRYRCDTPVCRCSYLMSISSGDGEQVEFTSQLLSSEERTLVSLLDSSREHSRTNLICMCSWCQRLVTPDNRWLPIEEAVAELRIMELPKLPGITHGICEDCVRVMERELEGIGPIK